MAKSKTVAYILWLFGGFYGLHHFYLGRDRQAFVWWAFLGGYCGLGWFRDLWRISSYVDEANETPEYLEELTKKMRKHKTPELGWVAFSGQMIVGNSFGYLCITAMPTELIPETIYPLFYLLIPAGCAVGVHLVGNVGRHQGSIYYALIGAYLTLPLYYFFDLSYIFLTTTISGYVFNWYGIEWRRTPTKPKHACKRIAILFLAGSLYVALWSSSLYFNTTITDADGNEIKLRDAVKHFMKSPMWQDFSDVMKLMYNHIKYHGFNQIWKEIVTAFDPSGTQNAYKVLNLSGRETQEEISSQYRRLSRQWHPDKHKDPKQKAIAEEKFIEIQEAYNILSAMKSKRKKRNERTHNE